MRRSTSRPWNKWYEGFPYIWYGFRGWSEEDRALALREIEEDRQAKLDANLMMANYAFGQAHEWVMRLDVEPRTYQEFLGVGQVRCRAVRKWLRDFWSGEDLPLPGERLLYLSTCPPRRNDWVREKWMQGVEQGEDRFKNYFQVEWTNDAVYSREEVEKMVDRGEISPKRADEMLRLR